MTRVALLSVALLAVAGSSGCQRRGPSLVTHTATPSLLIANAASFHTHYQRQINPFQNIPDVSTLGVVRSYLSLAGIRCD